MSGFVLAFEDSAYVLRIPLTVADSASALYHFTHILSFVFGFQKLFRIPQILLNTEKQILDANHNRLCDDCLKRYFIC